MKPRENKRKEMIKIRVEINEIHNRKIKQKTNKTRDSSLKRPEKLINLQPDCTGGKKKTQITNIRNERGDLNADSTDIERIIREYMNNFMPVNLTAQKKWMNCLKDINHQSSLKKNYIT